MTVREAELPAVRAGLEAAVAAQAGGARAGREIDAEVALGDVDLGLVGELDRLAPFGKGNEAPLLLGRGVPVLDVRRVGGGAHLKLALADGRGGRVDAIAFGQGGREVALGGAVDLAFTPFASAYRGDRVLELKVAALAPAGA
jgi:single-stranded-DNA-specific exonuclease